MIPKVKAFHARSGETFHVPHRSGFKNVDNRWIDSFGSSGEKLSAKGQSAGSLIYRSPAQYPGHVTCARSRECVHMYIDVVERRRRGRWTSRGVFMARTTLTTALERTNPLVSTLDASHVRTYTYRVDNNTIRRVWPVPHVWLSFSLSPSLVLFALIYLCLSLWLFRFGSFLT